MIAGLSAGLTCGEASRRHPAALRFRFERIAASRVARYRSRRISARRRDGSFTRDRRRVRGSGTGQGRDRSRASQRCDCDARVGEEASAGGGVNDFLVAGDGTLADGGRVASGRSGGGCGCCRRGRDGDRAAAEGERRNLPAVFLRGLVLRDYTKRFEIQLSGVWSFLSKSQAVFDLQSRRCLALPEICCY